MTYSDPTTRLEQPDRQQDRLFRIFFWIVVAGSLLAYFWGIWAIPILSHNEARRLVALQEMMIHHNWWLPTKNGLLYLEKPPLFYWSGGLVSILTGSRSEWVLRLPSALCALTITWLLFHRLCRHIGFPAALFSSAVLVGSYFFAELARVAELNMMFALWVFAAMLMFFSYLTEHSRYGLYLCYVFLGLAFLTKGPVVLLFFVLPIIAFAVLQKDRRALRGLLSGRGWLLFGLVALPWFVYVSLHLEGMPLLTVLKGQIAGKVRIAKADPFYFYPLFLLGAFAPWILFPAFHPRQQFRYLVSTTAGRFFAIAALVPLIVFSLIEFKRPKYILPACPSLAIVLGISLDCTRLRLQQRFGRMAPRLLVGVVGLLIMCNLGYYIWVQPRALRHRYATLPAITESLRKLPPEASLYYFKKEPIQLIYYLGHPIAGLDVKQVKALSHGDAPYYILAEEKYWNVLTNEGLCLQSQFAPYLHRNKRIGLWRGRGNSIPGSGEHRRS